MSTRHPAHFRYFLPPLTPLLDSFVQHASTLVFCPLYLSTRLDFHVQLSYLYLTRDWESFFSQTEIALIPKSISRTLLRTA
jgi:hypothetical protein